MVRLSERQRPEGSAVPPPPPSEHEKQIRAAIQQIWEWEESKGRKPDIERIFDFLNVDQGQRYELLKSEFVRAVNIRARVEPHEAIDVDAQPYSQYQTPEPDNENNHHREETLAVTIVDRGTGVNFKIKRTTHMNKIFDAFRERQGMMEDDMLFLYKDRVIATIDTAETLGMSDRDIIYANQVYVSQ